MQVFSTYESESESLIVDGSSTDESESESVHKSINTEKEKDEIDETEDEEPPETDNPVINDTIYFNLFEWSKHTLNRLDATCGRACMAT